MDMTLARVRGYGRALALLEAEKLKTAAVAVRAGIRERFILTVAAERRILRS